METASSILPRAAVKHGLFREFLLRFNYFASRNGDHVHCAVKKQTANDIVAFSACVFNAVDSCIAFVHLIFNFVIHNVFLSLKVL